MEKQDLNANKFDEFDGQRNDDEYAAETVKETEERKARLFVIKMLREELKILRRDFEGTLWRDRSSAERYLSFMSDDRSQLLAKREKIVLKEVDSVILDIVWKAICSFESILGDGSDKETQVRPFINRCLDVILKEVGWPYLKSHINTILSDETTEPDFVICSENITRPAWLDCLGFIECTTASGVDFNDDAGRVMEYGKAALQKASAYDAKIIRFSAVTDGRNIQIFPLVYENGEKNILLTEIADLLPRIRSESESKECSKGVRLLCQFVQLMVEQTVVFPSHVKFGGIEYPIRSNLQRMHSSSSVCTIEMDGSTCVVKYAEEKDTINLSLFREYHIYKYLSQQDEMRILELHDLSNEQMLIFKEEGTTLKSWSKRLLFPESGAASLEDKKTFLYVMRDVLGEIIKLHELDYTHNDIRPENILVLPDDQVCLIDLDCINRLDSPREFIFGISEYFPSVLAATSVEPPYWYLRIYDLEAFVYTFLDCVAPGFFEMTSKAFKFYNHFSHGINSKEFILYRKEIIDEIVKSEHPIKLAKTEYHSDLFKVFVELYLEVLKFKDDVDIFNVYTEFEEILTL